MMWGQAILQVSRVVDHDDLSSAPVEFERGITEGHAVMLCRRGESFFLSFIVVAVHAMDGRRKLGQGIEDFRLCDVTRVHHALHARTREDFDDLSDISEIVVGIANDTNSHFGLLSTRVQERQFLGS